MRSLLALVVATGSVLASLTASVAADAEAAKAIIDAAIQAHGGRDALAKTALMTRQAKGSMSFSGQEVPFTDELVLQLPQRWRWTLEAGNAGHKTKLLFVLNGDQGWQSAGGMVMELSKQKLEELHAEAYVLWLSTHLPLIKDSGFSLAALPDVEVEGHPAACIRVEHKGRRDLRLYFEKQTGLLVQIARRAKLADLTVEKDYIYSAHRRFEGVQLPTKYAELANGKKLVEVTDISYQFLRSVDERAFARP
jgi:hypothetical protein